MQQPRPITSPAPVEMLSRLSLVAGTILVMAILYFQVARIGLALVSTAERVAVIWPASGLGVGAMLLAGTSLRWAVAAGILLGTVGASLLADRSLALAVTFGLCNAGEALLIDWLLRRWFPSREPFGDLRATMWFFGATVASAATMAAIAAGSIALNAQASSTFFNTWQAWCIADFVGVLAFAPALMTIGGILRRPLEQRELLEGAGFLLLLVAMTAPTYLATASDPRFALFPLPVAALFPVLPLVAARCRPIVLATGIALISLMIVWAKIRGHGPFGGAGLPADARFRAAHITIVAIAVTSLVLVAVFAERRAREAHIDYLMEELNHRSKNLLSVVQAVALNAIQEEPPHRFFDAFSDRLAGLAASHDLLIESRWESVDLGALVATQLKHFEGLFGSRILIEGPPALLVPESAQSIGMALHELATNASKYGALATADGRIRIQWEVADGLDLSWTETGRPAPEPEGNATPQESGGGAAPARQGFGHRVMVEMLEYQGAKVRLELLRPAGIIWQMSAPRDVLAAAAPRQRAGKEG